MNGLQGRFQLECTLRQNVIVKDTREISCRAVVCVPSTTHAPAEPLRVCTGKVTAAPASLPSRLAALSHAASSPRPGQTEPTLWVVGGFGLCQGTGVPAGEPLALAAVSCTDYVYTMDASSPEGQQLQRVSALNLGSKFCFFSFALCCIGGPPPTCVGHTGLFGIGAIQYAVNTWRRMITRYRGRPL